MGLKLFDLINPNNSFSHRVPCRLYLSDESHYVQLELFDSVDPNLIYFHVQSLADCTNLMKPTMCNWNFDSVDPNLIFFPCIVSCRLYQSDGADNVELVPDCE